MRLSERNGAARVPPGSSLAPSAPRPGHSASIQVRLAFHDLIEMRLPKGTHRFGIDDYSRRGLEPRRTCRAVHARQSPNSGLRPRIRPAALGKHRTQCKGRHSTSARAPFRSAADVSIRKCVAAQATHERTSRVTTRAPCRRLQMGRRADGLRYSSATHMR